jgi:hypothetical protein
MTIREYFKNLYSSKLKSLKETDEFLDTYDLPKLSQENTENLNRSIMNNEMEVVINHPTKKKKNPGVNKFTTEFYVTFKEELTSMLLKLFHKSKGKQCLQTNSMKPVLPFY